MNLHPDERPDNVRYFRQSLVGDRPTIPRPISKLTSYRDIFSLHPEQTMFWAAVLLLMLSFLLTVGK
jgi:hypothetical protein